MKKRKMVVSLLLVLTFVVALTSIAFAQEDKKLVFGMVPKTLANPGFLIAKRGADVRAAELGDVEIYWTAPLSANVPEQIEIIEGLIAKKVDGLLINSNGPGVDVVINQAMKAGIPVVAWDCDAPDSKRICYVGTDDYKGGLACAELFLEATKGKGHQKIAILTGVPGVYNLGQRDRGFIDGIKGADIEIVITVPCYDDLARSVDVVEGTTRAYPELTAWFFDGPWPLLVDPESLPLFLSKIKKGELTVVSYDTLPQQLPWVEQDLVYGVVGQKYYGWGYQSVSVLHNIVKYGKKYPEFVDMGMDVVTKEGGPGRYTAKEFARKWEEFDFTEPPL